MSADNWALCPKCVKEKAKEERALAAVYGKVTMEEYHISKRNVEERWSVAWPETLQEDWELGVDSNGIFKMWYGCKCERCGFEWSTDMKVNTLEGKNENT